MIHYQRHGCPPLSDYKKPRDGRLVIPWAMHPRALRGDSFVPSDLTPFLPCIYNQDRIGACSACGSVGAAQTTLKKAGVALPGIAAPLSVYTPTRAIERAVDHPSGTLPPLTDTGAYPDDALRVMQLYGMRTTVQECGEAGPSEALSEYEDAHVNDEPNLLGFEQAAAFRLLGGFDIVTTGQQRLDDVAAALAAGYAVGRSVYASDDRFQRYVGGVMPAPPANVWCDHWIYTVGCYKDAAGTMIFPSVNSWSTNWGESWGSAPGGMFRAGPADIQAADAVIVFAVTEVQS